MNAERLAEIRKWADDPTLLRIGPTVLRELLDHIDGLKFANGVLDSAAKDAQTWSYEAQTAKEAYCELLEANRVMEAEGGAIAQLNRMIDELRAQLEAQRGGAVVVPDDAAAWMYAHGNDGAVIVCGEKASGEEFQAKFRAIPADRVLGEGQVAMDWDERDLLGRLHMVAMQFVIDSDPAQRRAAAHLVQAVAALRQYESCAKAGGEG